MDPKPTPKFGISNSLGEAFNIIGLSICHLGFSLLNIIPTKNVRQRFDIRLDFSGIGYISKLFSVILGFEIIPIYFKVFCD